MEVRQTLTVSKAVDRTGGKHRATKGWQPSLSTYVFFTPLDIATVIGEDVTHASLHVIPWGADCIEKIMVTTSVVFPAGKTQRIRRRSQISMQAPLQWECT